MKVSDKKEYKYCFDRSFASYDGKTKNLLHQQEEEGVNIIFFYLEICNQLLVITFSDGVETINELHYMLATET